MTLELPTLSGFGGREGDPQGLGGDALRAMQLPILRWARAAACVPGCLP